ncbi:MAG: dual specificity protein phosphatase family protein [Aigarchaeota archaeon]|nr:dual specificity protein phosphatase family protein [Aigarchaeota archaeon]
MVEDTPYRFSWIDENVAGCGRPMSSDQVKWVKDRGITMIISLTESQLPSEWIEPLNLKYLHFPLRDHSTPDPEVIKKIVEEILKEVNNGGRVLVHCAAGLGRTGVVLASYLIVKKKIPPEEGIKIVRKMRPGSIEPHQEKSIYEFYRRISEE